MAPPLVGCGRAHTPGSCKACIARECSHAYMQVARQVRKTRAKRGRRKHRFRHILLSQAQPRGAAQCHRWFHSITHLPQRGALVHALETA